MNEKHDCSQWPPPPDYGFGNDMQVSEPEIPARLLTGSVRSDAALGIAFSLITFTVLIFALVNPLATSVLPPPSKFPVGLRLLIGWFFASVTQFAAWKLFLAGNFQVIHKHIVLTALPMAVVWLLLSLMAWAFG